MDYLLFRNSLEGPDVILQGDGSEGVDGEGDSVKGVELPSVKGW